ncbi:DUF3515 domain-containing protein [Rhodococcus sp. D2-41]|uniref:DUF3515 domain-containing protein n=1 Tax=Speluncibacter jeojiensis TaxID=2710754 RepID=A0A9X4LZF1_9ACTN|nr:DUF3515 domain-containing protein [Rhodococcus sp. D2-41]MDG3011064.1 DUF3515 domain-containing protein [Rhodococcus sp. D2-41]MDG3014042.1 DUF3515 domain-containing protein [Corynebacteriales bacterium D3-21]
MSPHQNTEPDADGDKSTDARPSGAASSAADTTPRRHPALIATAVALPVALLVGIIVAAVMTGRTTTREPVALGAVPAPQAESAECTEMLEAMPDSLDDYQRAELVKPAPAGALAWNKADGGQAITLRCGLDRPAEFVQGSALQVVDDVQWLQVSGKDQGLDASTWYVVDRGVYAALTLPDGTGPTPIQAVSDAIAKALPAKPIDPAPAPHS